MKNKFLCIAAVLLAICTAAAAQARIDKYCQVRVGNPDYVLYLKNSSAKISLGEKRELFAPRDTAMVSQLKKVNSLTTETDVLNYMSSLGWSVVNIHAIANKWEVIYFKKQFDAAEFVR
nr:hypothetical protein [Pedobacter sp. ASV19]